VAVHRPEQKNDVALRLFKLRQTRLGKLDADMASLLFDKHRHRPERGHE
jgi:hypothetical protein